MKIADIEHKLMGLQASQRSGASIETKDSVVLQASDEVAESEDKPSSIKQS